MRLNVIQRPFILAGAKFRPTFAQLATMSLKVGDEVTLKADPFNEYDHNAVQVLVADENGTHHIGFVPREIAADLSPLLQAGCPATCRCVIADAVKLKPHFLLEVDDEVSILA